MQSTKWFVYEQRYPFYNMVRIREDKWSSSGWQIWPSAWFLAKFLERSMELEHLPLKDAKILELGAGCALPSIIAASLGATVTASDCESALACTEMNVSTSKYVKHESKFEELKIHSERLAFGEKVTDKNARGKYNFIMASDVLHDKELYSDFLLTLLQLVDNNNSVLLSHIWRDRGREKAFFEMANEFFVIHEIATEEEIKAYVTLQDESAGPAGEVRRRGSSIHSGNIKLGEERKGEEGRGGERRGEERRGEEREEEMVILEMRLKDEWAYNLKNLEKVVEERLRERGKKNLPVEENFGVDLISKYNRLHQSQTSTVANSGIF